MIVTMFTISFASVASSAPVQLCKALLRPSSLLVREGWMMGNSEVRKKHLAINDLYAA